jgi:hypothetical protein
MDEGDVAAAPVTLKQAAAIVYRDLTVAALEEASNLASIEPELALLRVWVRDAVLEGKTGADGMRRLMGHVIRALEVRHRLSPKRLDDFSTAVAAVFEYMDEQRPERVEV